VPTAVLALHLLLDRRDGLGDTVAAAERRGQRNGGPAREGEPGLATAFVRDLDRAAGRGRSGTARHWLGPAQRHLAAVGRLAPREALGRRPRLEANARCAGHRITLEALGEGFDGDRAPGVGHRRGPAAALLALQGAGD